MGPLQRLVIGAVGSIETDPGRLDPILNLVQAQAREASSNIERLFHER
jgi:hypothetical protein